MARPSLSDWAGPADATCDRRFGHIRYDPLTMDREKTWSDILRDILGTTGPECVLVGTSTLEKAVVKAAFSKLSEGYESAQEFKALNYQELVKELEILTSRCQHRARSDCAEANSFFRRIVVLVMVEPDLPADCALAIVAATHFIPDGDLSLRILTVSNRSPERAIRRMLEFKNLKYPTFEVSSYYSSTWRRLVSKAKEVRMEPSTIVEELEKSTADLSGSQIIVVFSGEISGFTGPDAFEEWEFQPSDSLKSWSDAQKAMTATESSKVILYVEDGFQPPFGLSGFDHVHVVCSSSVRRLAYDSATGQLVDLELSTSTQERLEQTWWVSRLETEPSSLTIYHDADSIWLFATAKPELRRLKVWNEHMGAFMSSLAMSRSMVDATKVAEFFVPEGFMCTFLATRIRLRAQLLLKPQVHQMGINLEGDELSIFETVLPHLQYDHRPAYFIAQRSGDLVVRQTKLQLAALISLGFGEELYLQRPSEAPPIYAAQFCEGYTKPLSWNGGMWLSLGLWKCLAGASNDFGFDVNMVETVHLMVANSDVWLNKFTCSEAMDLFNVLRNALDEVGFPYLRSAMRGEVEMTPNQCKEIQLHLLKAYAGQLVVGTMVNNVTRWYDVSTRKEIHQLAPWMHGYTNIESIRPPGDTNAIFGIYHKLTRRGSELSCNDLTFVHIEVVKRWLSSLGVSEIGGVLGVDQGPAFNFDDVD